MENNNYHDVIVIGLGPGGMGISETLIQENIDVLVIEKSMPGGKVNIAPRVDNYPGYKEIAGPDLAESLYKKYLNYHINTLFDEVIELKKENKDYFTLRLKSGKLFSAKFVVVASGTKEKMIGLEKEKEFLGHGISYCSICDGHFFKNKPVVVVGGGNSALKEAIHLSAFVSHLYLIHRRNEFRGNKKLVDELKEKQNVEILTPFVPLKIIGENKVKGLLIKNNLTNEEKTLEVEGFFPLVGQDPNTSFIKINGVLDNYNLIPVNQNKESNVKNLFAVGDVLPRGIRQIYLSEFDGKIAAKEIIKRIKGNNEN